MRSTSARLTALVATIPDQRLILRHLGGVRWGLLASAITLALVGLATVHSASSELALDYLPKQALRIVLGLLAFAVAFSFDYQVLTRFAVPIYAAAMLLLVLVLLVGAEAGGARSWLRLGTAQLQPSDIAKLATILLLARYLAGINRSFIRIPQILTSCGITAFPVLLVALERDLGGAAMFVPILVGMLLIGGVRWRVLVAGALLLLALGVLVWNFAMLDYQRVRVKTFLSPGSDPLNAGYQLQQSKIAVGAGMLIGRGYMQGTQSQLRFLPARHTDFIFAVLAEEWGFVGVLVVLALFSSYIMNGFAVAFRARDRTAILLVVGLLSLASFHVLYNTAMVVGLVPITGIPLPFLSYGGSFIVANFVAAGLILGIDFRRHVNR